MSEIKAYMEHKYGVSLSLNIATTLSFSILNEYKPMKCQVLKLVSTTFYQMIAL